MINKLKLFFVKLLLNKKYLFYCFHNDLNLHYNNYFERYGQDHNFFAENVTAKQTQSSNAAFSIHGH